MRQRFALLEIVAACALLAACGGGGGEADAGVAPAQADGAVPDPAAAATDGESATQASLENAPAPDPSEPWGLMEAASAQWAGQDAPEPPPAALLEEDGSADGSSGRESAQSLSIDSSDAGYRRPKVAALDYSSDSTSARAAQLAKFKFVVLAGRGASTIASFAQAIRSRNSGVPIAAYVIFNSIECSVDSSSSRYSLVQAVNKTDWWLHNADGSRAHWSSLYNHCDLNISSWARRDASGRTWQQYKASYDYNNLFRIAGAVNWVFSDNTFNKPRVDADWRRIGTNQLRTDSTIISAQRAGQLAYWSALHNYKSSLRVMGNVDSDMSASQYVDKIHGGWIEGAMGRSYSPETWAGWGAMMDRYRALERNTISGAAVLQVYGDPLDFRQMRYGLASALLQNGYYAYLPKSGTLKSAWYDEYEAPLGDPLESPPTAAKQNGIWARKYSNGIVLVNPSKTDTRSIYIGTAYRRLKGTQNPSVNSGEAQSTVTLAPRSGLIMIRR